MKWLHRGALAAGIALFAWVVAQVGVAHLWQQAVQLGWAIALIVAIEGVADFTHTCGWRMCFWPEFRHSPFDLWGPNLAANAINYVTPTATFGGEVVRATLAPRDIPNSEMVASLTINRLTDTVPHLSGTLAGVVVVLMLAPLPLPVQIAIAGTAALLSAGIAGFLLVQRSGRLAGWVARHPLVERLLGADRGDRVARGASALDRRLARFHRERWRDVLASLGLHVIGLSLGAVQLYVFLAAVGAPADARSVAIVFTVGKAVDMAAFFIPARLGAQEGGRVLGMQLVGVPGELGLLFSLVLRLEQLFWTGIGLAAYAAMITSRRRSVKAVV